MFDRPTLKMFVLGQAIPKQKERKLLNLVEFRAGRAIARVRLAESVLKDLEKRFFQLRGFIEAGFPPFDECLLRELGSELFDRFIRGDVKRLFDIATGQRDGLLPFEILSEDYEIASWPWEYLYDPTTKMFICQEFHPISRGIFALSPQGQLKAPRGKVKILLVVGVRPDEPGTTPREEIKWIREVFSAALAAGSIEIETIQAMSPTQLESALQASRYDILHFFGHAGFDGVRKEGYLKFGPPSTQGPRLYAINFAQLLAEQKIRLVFLNACETAKVSQSQDPARSSLAAALLARGIPAVIATQFSMPDTSAHFLSAMIYNALVTGKPVVDAVRYGRRAVLYAESSQFFDWGIPVLYSTDPNTVIFPHSMKQREPKWVTRFEDALKSPSVIRGLTVHQVSGGPAISVERTARSVHKWKPKATVALIDIDSKVSFLPDLVKVANEVQEFYQFQVIYLPIPSGAVRTDFEGTVTLPQMFLPRLEKYLSSTPGDLGVDLVCCLTRHMIAGQENDRLYWNHFAAPLGSNGKVSVISTFGLRQYSLRAKAPFAKAALFLCLAMLIVADNRWQLKFHEETLGCMFDYCRNRDDLVQGVRHMRFDHAACRNKIKDEMQLKAIDALLSLEV